MRAIGVLSHRWFGLAIAVFLFLPRLLGTDAWQLFFGNFH